MVARVIDLKILAESDAARRQLDEIILRGEAIKKLDPTLSVRVDRTMVTQGLAVLNAQTKAALRDKTMKITAKVDVDTSQLGMLERLIAKGGGSGGGLSGIASMLFGGAPGGAAAAAGGIGPLAIGGGILAGIAALESGIAGVIPVLAAAGVGVAAFGALAIPTFTAVTGAISGVSAANGKFAEAAQNVDIAIRTSSLDAKIYQANLAALPPGLRAAEVLLGNTSVTWQDLTTSQQDNVIALSQNKDALKNMLPAQRTALAQLLASKSVWDQLSPAQQKVARGWQTLSASYQNLATALAPDVLGIFNSGLKIANSLLPVLLPLAQAAGGALGTLAANAAKFFQLDTKSTKWEGFGKSLHAVTVLTPTPFGEFVTQMTKLAGPAIMTLGDGFGKIAVALGKLMEAMMNPNGIKILRVGLEGIAGIITGFAAVFAWATPRVITNIHTLAVAFDDTRRFFITWGHDIETNFDNFRHRTAVIFDGMRGDVHRTWDNTWNDTVGRTERGITDVMLWIGSLPGKIRNVFAGAGTWLYNTGRAVLQGLENGAVSLWNTVTGFFSGLGTAILHGVEHILGIHSPSAAFYGVGVNIMTGLLHGLQSEAGHITSWMDSLATSVMGKIPGMGGVPHGGLGGSATQNMVTMQGIANSLFGWGGGNNWQALFNVEMAEAGFSLTATNPTSGAYGMAQFIQGPSEYYAYGGDPNTAKGQSIGMLNYIRQRYGSPEAAWAHEQAFHWYDQGGYLPRGLSLALNTTGSAEAVVPAAKLDDIAGGIYTLAGQLDTLIGVTAQGPAVMGAAMGGASRSATYRALYP